MSMAQIPATVMATMGLSSILLLATGCANAAPYRGFELESAKDTGCIVVPCVKQSKKWQCGYACMASVSIYYEVQPERTLREDVAKEFSGKPLCARELCAMAESFGFQAFGYQGDLPDLKNNIGKRRPVIVLLATPPRTGHYPTFEWVGDMLPGGPHWVVVTGFLPNGSLIICDPAKGYLQMSEAAFSEAWAPKSRTCVLVAVKSPA
jgi:ABC-type bacteriocin/lantibiotic exporter with double-glycine peptidase domain